MIKTILFDLDDTIFDHKFSRLTALSTLKGKHPLISDIALEELEQEHERLLAGNYTKVLDGALTIKDSMIERTYLLFEKYDIKLTYNEAVKYTQIYKNVYDMNRRAIPKVKELMKHLKMSYNIGIVSNGIFELQDEKVKICEIEDMIDFMILSEDVKSRKPDRGIFEAALLKSGSKPEEAVFIGDSWVPDIVGASNCGIRTIWINRYNQDCPDCNLTYQIQSYNEITNILDYIANFSIDTDVTANLGQRH